jgi:hypothetical protein
MKYFLFILFFLLSGCILDQDQSDSKSVQLSNFRSATVLSYKTTNSDWIKIEDDPDDIFVFKTENDKKYQVSIDCPFNERKQKRLYLLDSKNFSKLDLNCDAMLDNRITIDDVPNNILSYELYTPYSLEPFIFTPCFAFFCFLDNAVKDSLTSNRIDQDNEIEVMGEVCFDTDICQMYYRKEKSDYIFNAGSLDLNDKNFLYDFPSIKIDEYNPTPDNHEQAQQYYYSLNTALGYFSSDNKAFPLTTNGYNLGIPQEIRSKNDGYLYKSNWQENQVEIFSPSYSLFQSSKYSDVPGLKIWGEEAIEFPVAQLQPKFIRSNSEEKADAISFNKFIGSEFKATYYSLFITNYQIFIANSYATKNMITINLPEKIMYDESADLFFLSVFNQLHINGVLTRKIDGNHKMQPTLSVQDSSYHYLLNTPQTESQ